MIGNGRIIKTELQFLVVCIQHMRDLQKTDAAKAQVFRREMEAYFRLPSEMCNSFVYDTLLQLDNITASMLNVRDPNVLRRLHSMIEGEYFHYDKVLCIFMKHSRFGGDPKEGWFSYRCFGEINERSLYYDEAWSLATDGRITFGQ